MMNDELKQWLLIHHSSFIIHHYENGLRFAAAQREVIIAHADFERVAERRGLDDAYGSTRNDAHLHQTTRDRALASNGEHARMYADAQAVERNGRRAETLGRLN